MQLIEWEVAEDDYQEQIIIPKEQRDLAAKEGINTEEKQKVAVQILNLNTGESYTGRSHNWDSSNLSPCGNTTDA